MRLNRGATIGILGDGQLGRMIAHAAQRKGFRVHGFGPDRSGPLGQVTGHFTQAGFDDAAALAAFTVACDVVTSEFENVPLPTLDATHCQPSAPIFALAQDRLREKQAAQDIGLPTAPFFAIDTLDDLPSALDDLGGQGILKTRRLGYDGKGQWRLTQDSDLARIWQQTPQQDLILEGVVPFAFETSALIVRNDRGQTAVFPCGENVHRQGILHQSIVPGRVRHATQAKAHEWAQAVAENLKPVGLLALEFFVLEDDSLIFNEMAPRPHNSGHWTMDGCDHSQFDVLIDALTGQDLPQPQQSAPTTMTNLIGDDIHHIEPGHWYDYGKADSKPGRKMGHVTVCG